MPSNIIKELAVIQQALKAPKGQRNSFGNYNYRSCEDILEAVKPLLGDNIITLEDEIVEVGGRVYVKATATFTTHDGNSIHKSAWAREPLAKKGNDDAQITGATSSYARKYALNGLLLIDDTKDADTMDNSQEGTQKAPQKASKPHPNSKEAKEQKAREQGVAKLYAWMQPLLADETQHDFVREALEEVEDKQIKQMIWNLLNSREKEIVRSLKGAM